MLYQLKAGIIGLDELGMAYAQLLKNHIKDLSLIGAVGRTQKELLHAKNDLSLEYVYSDNKSLMENHDIDAIFLFGDVQQRPHLAIQAIDAGKHLFVADPISKNVEDAIAVKAAADSHPSQVVMVSSLVRFNPLLRSVKKLIERGEIGIVNHISLDSAFFNGLNRRYNQTSGSTFLDNTLDELDLCSWLLDSPFSEVTVETRNFTIICEGKTEGNSSINIIVQPELRKEQSYLNIYGNSGQIVVSNVNHRSFKLYKDTGEKLDQFTDDKPGFQYSEYLQLHHFTNAVLNKTKPLVKTDHAVDLIRIGVAFEKAKVLGKRMEL